MKFFLCCGSGCSGSGARLQQKTPEESTLLVAPETRLRAGRKRGRSAAERRSGAVDWQPSLSSISEDNVLPEKYTLQPPPPPPPPPLRSIKRKSGGASVTQRDRTRSSHRNDIRRSSVPVTLPTFSPTPFLFL